MAQRHPQNEYVAYPHATQYLCINQVVRAPIFQCALAKNYFCNASMLVQLIILRTLKSLQKQCFL